MELILLALILLLVAAGGGILYLYQQVQKLSNNKPEQLSELEAIERASQIAKEKLIEAEKKAKELEDLALESSKSAREKLKEQEKIITDRESALMQRSNNLDKRVNSLEDKEKDLEVKKQELKRQEDALGAKLEKVAQMSKEEAAEELKKQTEKELSDWTAKKVKENEAQISIQSEQIAQKILVDAMQKSAVDFTAETTTTSVTIDDDNLKGRIIGKDGRNVRAFERLTGVDVIIDEAPNQVTISCFDPIRREVGALALQKLLKDGRINPASIEETIEKVKKDMLKEIRKTGEEIAYETGFHDLPQEIIMLLGRFKYRYSYGQNLAKHTLEMVKIGAALAEELGANVRTTKLACLLHDIGKVIPEEGKQHHHISAEIARKHFKGDEVLANAIEAHHFDIDAKYTESEIVRIADAISGARPGARRDSYEEYVQRIRALEDIANRYNGVKESFAIKAGREVRVIVKPDKASDEDAKAMAFKIAKEIEDTQSYPGVIKVTVIREYRAEEEAK